MTTSNESEENSGDNVKVVVRVRPANEEEKAAKYANIVGVDHINGTVRLVNPNQVS